METIKFTTDENIKVVLYKQFFNAVEEAVSLQAKEEYDEDVDIFYDGYELKTIRFNSRGITVYYENKEGKEINMDIRYNEIKRQ